MAPNSVLPVALQNKLRSARKSSSGIVSSSSFNLVRNVVFLVFLLRIVRKTFYTLRGHGILGSVFNAGAYVRLVLYSLFLRTPGVRGKVDKQIAAAISKMEAKIAPETPGIPKNTSLPKLGWSHDRICEELDKLASMDHTEWEEGRVSGAVYHGGDELVSLQTAAFGQFAVANPIHPDVFPGVRKMEAEIVAMVLALFNAPECGAGVTTSGGTESILMACLSARQKAYVERRVTEPEMIIPDTAHAAFNKACHYFGIKLHSVHCPPPDYKVHIPSVLRLINPNTILLVGSAPNFPHGIVDDIPALSRLALNSKIPLHVDCCLGSFVISFLKRAGYPSPYEEEGGFDFRQPGVTSISVDTHKYGFAPKGNSVILYRNRKLRSYQYFIHPDWSGGAAGQVSWQWANRDMSTAAHQIISATRTFEQAIREHPVLSSSLKIIGQPLVSVVAWESKTPDINIYDIADALADKGWHLNALQSPPGMHVAFTVPTATAVERLVADLVAVVEREKEKVAERKRLGQKVENYRGDTSALYGVAGSIPDKSIVNRFAEGFLDTLYLA
ncbi:L-tyrosine decarboxylase [Paracoccidioides lutzii Pb01]|uniref:sphinganine-1-phosphate aldolase n=1 Tax=Paracoccidioides lutzii (strain ATCC MYA-826 / Pb01) TaxID=502779 RepID=C1GVQ9_PARBA|nr:L-tyrosine decarboxylase [Paracoccidioides lutzii Pb01]EEH40628.2 L-tyrosine decarboxylase [Paracoccidioides lutzii Pb01]